MTDRLRIALAQLNPKVGDLAGNLALARGALADAVAAKADILLLSELFLTGYFPDDLLFKPKFVADAMQAARDLVAEHRRHRSSSLILPTVWQDEDRAPQRRARRRERRDHRHALQARTAQYRRLLREALLRPPAR